MSDERCRRDYLRGYCDAHDTLRPGADPALWQSVADHIDGPLLRWRLGLDAAAASEPPVFQDSRAPSAPS